MLAAGLRVIRADLRSRPLHTVLTGLVVAFALGALVVTLHGRATLDDPYDRLFRATDGAHVTAISQSREDLARVASLPGIATSEGPRPLVRRPGPLRRRGRHARADRAPARAGACRAPADPRRPRRARAGRGRRCSASSLASTASTSATRSRPGSARSGANCAWWASARPRAPPTAAGATPPTCSAWPRPSSRCSSASALRLDDPAAAKAFALRAARSAPGGSIRTFDWRTQRTERTDDSRRLLTILQTTTVLALLAAAFTLATAIGGRVLAQRRQIGLLRAIGLTPIQVTGLLVAHYLVLAALAAPLGLVAGGLVAERLSATPGRRARRARPPAAERRAVRGRAAGGADRRRGRHGIAGLARGADAGPGRARARPRRELGARLAGRPARAAAAPPGRGRRRRQGRLRAARAHDPHRLQPRAGRRAGGDGDGLRGDDGPPGERPGAARAALRAAGASPRSRPPRSTACSPAAGRSPRSRACARSS